MKNKIIKYWSIFIIIGLFLFPPFMVSVTYGNPARGDVNDDGQINLTDAILSLQVLVQMNPSGIRADYASSGVDINSDNKIGLEEAIYIMQDMSGLRILAPTGVTATAGDGQVSISWSAVSGATSYNIYWSETSGVTKVNGTQISDATSPYTHTGRTNGTTYYYIVTAVNSSGESVKSAQVSATASTEGIVFVSSRDGWGNIWVMDIDGSNPRRLSLSEESLDEGYPSSSPDGSKTVFTRYGEGIVELDNSGEKTVRSYDLNPTYTTWSYNGKIYFSRWNNALPGAKEYIYSVNADGTGEAQVSLPYDSEYNALDRHPSISPDGSALLFSTNRGILGIHIEKMDIGDDSSSALIVSVSDEFCFQPHQPSWSPDGNKIVFVAYSDNREIYLANADGTGIVLIASDPEAHCDAPSWSPDGSKIVFHKKYLSFSDNVEIWIMNADGSGAQALTDRTVTHHDGYPCFIKKPI